MRYLPHTESEIAAMLDAIGVGTVDELFSSIPEAARFTGKLNLAPALAEPELMAHLHRLAEANDGPRKLSFLGAGSYPHHIPPAVGQLLMRSEFYTAYTPYQPEVAQGTLQAIFEFQTIVSELLGLPMANASLYDGASALAEGAQMARRLTRRNRIVVGTSVHPAYLRVLQTYLAGDSLARIVVVDDSTAGGPAALSKAVDSETAACLVGYPAFRGDVWPLQELAAAVHHQGALLVSSTTEPYALGVVEAPGAQGVDIATGEGQALSTAPNFGGPYLGLFACRDERKYQQQLPGRICGQTVDSTGRRGYVLTLATREQHIRRERATSNICTNQGLIALALTIRVCLLGRRGFEDVARACLSKAQYLKEAIGNLPNFDIANLGPTFNEFVFRHRTLTGEQVSAALAADGIVAGLCASDLEAPRALPGDTSSLPLGSRDVLCAVTELHGRAQLDSLIAALQRIGA